MLDIPVHGFRPGSLASLKDATVIQGHLDRTQRALPTDPELAIGSAEELIESTAKLVLDQRGVSYDKSRERPGARPALSRD